MPLCARLSVEKNELSLEFVRANFLVTDAHLRMGLTQHTVREDSWVQGFDVVRESRDFGVWQHLNQK